MKLYNNIEIPERGLGVFQITSYHECKQTVIAALEMGYRLIDTAACYHNELAVGDAIKESKIPRSEIFLVTKVWIDSAGYDRTMKSFEESLERLGVDYIDLYLIHMPYGDYHGSYRALEQLYRQGKVKAIGVCNFVEDRLVDLILSHEIVPMVNQMECHPYCQQDPLRALMAKYNIKMMAWAPFAQGREHIFENEIIGTIARHHQKSPAQVILRYLQQKGIITIPKSVNPVRLEENLATFDFELDNDEMNRIQSLDLSKSMILDIHSSDEAYRLHGIEG